LEDRIAELEKELYGWIRKSSYSLS
jgi:hypothetical protein